MHPLLFVSGLDYAVIGATLLAIAIYGIWRTRHGGGAESFLRGDADARWGSIGLSVMATQASAITFLSTPGQAYESGMGFVQNYFGLPFALIVVCAFFIPAFRRLNVFTAYEYLGRRFDQKTRRLGAGLFLIQRGLATGITIYAPAIILSAIAGWNLNATILLSGGLVIVYTTTGGARAVNLTQKYQLGVVFLGMCSALGMVIWMLPHDVSLGQAVALAGKMGKLSAVDFSLDPEKRYTVWSGLLGGFFLALSYFGADQTQVQRYLAGGSVTGSRLGLIFNALCKIPMQCFILFIGAMVFIFYQFEKPPILFNRPAYELGLAGPAHDELVRLEKVHETTFTQKQAALRGLLCAMSGTNSDAVRSAQADVNRFDAEMRNTRDLVKKQLIRTNAKAETKDSDFVFITFVLDHLPRGLVGLLFAVIICAAMSAAAAGLGGLSSTTVVDFYRPLLRPNATDQQIVFISRIFTVAWGVVAIGFALFASLVENLLEAGNILGSLFYGSILGLFLAAFFLPFVRGSAVFFAGVVAQSLVLTLYFTTSIGYLWYNVIGCFGVMLFAALFQVVLFRGEPGPHSSSSA